MRVPASTTDILRLRLASHGLDGATSGGPVAVVERMLAVQAQDLAAGRWALGVRSPGTTVREVDDAIDSGSIVRSWPMRGTLHLVPAADLAWMLELTTARLISGARARRKQLGLDDAIIEHARSVAVSALEGNRRLGRAAFLRLLDDHGISTADQRGYHLIWHLCQTGTLCWGPRDGSAQALVLLDEWVPHPRRLEHDEALGEFVVRYLAGHGPATLHDFVSWSKLTVAEARVGFAVAAASLVELDVDGTVHHLTAATDTGQLGGHGPVRQHRPVLALPAFDEYLLGYRDRAAVIEDHHFARVVPGRNGVFQPIMLAGGQVIGTWRKKAGAGPVAVEPVPFAPMVAADRAAFGRAVDDYGRFLGTGAVLAAE